MVDAKHVFFAEDAVDHRVQRLRRGQVTAKRFLDHNARALSATRLAELMDDGFKQDGRDGEVVHRMSGLAQFPAQLLKSRRVAIVAVNIAQETTQLRESLR